MQVQFAPPLRDSARDVENERDGIIIIEGDWASSSHGFMFILVINLIILEGNDFLIAKDMSR